MAVPRFHWTKSLPVDSRDSGIGTLGGTEARCLVAMDHKLYAGIGYWMDSEHGNPRLPGAQILRLDSPGSDWKVDLQLDERLTTGKRAGQRRYLAIAVLKTITIDSDFSGKKLPNPTDIVLAGTWDLLGKLEVFSKESGHDHWADTPLGQTGGTYAEIRSFGIHRDRVTNIQRVFAGARITGPAVASQIYSGAYDPSVPGGIRWDAKPENWLGDLANLARTLKGSARVTGFAECNGKLYATVYNVIYERQDGNKPTWKPVWTYEPKKPLENGSSGFRGLTAVANPDGEGQVLLVSLEHNPGQIFRVDPRTWTSTREMNVTNYLEQAFGTKSGYVIAGYNDMLLYDSTNHQQDCPVLIGIEGRAPLMKRAVNSHNPDAHYLIREPNGTYSLHEIVDPALQPKPVLISVRSLICSPFSDDPPGAVYASGYDANGNPAHNTAWIYRGTPESIR